MKSPPLGAVAIALVVLAPMPARAQSAFVKDNVTKIVRKIGIHGNITFREPIDSDVSKGRSLGVSIGLSPGRTNGWKYPFALSMYGVNLHSPNGVEFGELRSTAIVGGIGYGWHFGRLSTGAQLQTGYSFNTDRETGDRVRAFGSPNVSVHTGNAFLLRPQLKAEYFVTEKFTVRTSGGYVMMRPDVTVTTPTERLTGRWDASNFNVTVGVGFYPFRK